MHRKLKKTTIYKPSGKCFSFFFSVVCSLFVRTPLTSGHKADRSSLLLTFYGIVSAKYVQRLLPASTSVYFTKMFPNAYTIACLPKQNEKLHRSLATASSSAFCVVFSELMELKFTSISSSQPEVPETWSQTCTL